MHRYNNRTAEKPCEMEESELESGMGDIQGEDVVV